MSIKRRWFLLLFLLFIAWLYEGRSFYCSTSGPCVTLWKTCSGICYVIPGKYYGLWKPSDNYIQTQNTDLIVSVFWNKKYPNSILVDASGKALIVNSPKQKVMIYKDPGIDIYKPGKKYYQIREDIELINIRVLEGWATGSNGEIL